jgi:superfamily II DNA or RNA helicase
MKDMLAKIAPNKKQFLIDGHTKLSYREEARETMEAYDNCFLLGNTKCFGTGINIKNIQNIGFGFSSGLRCTKIVQAIGRGLRLFDGKTDIWVVDFYHNFRYSIDHFGKRMALYKENYELNKIIYKYIDVPKNWQNESNFKTL